MKEIIVNVDNYNENSIKTIEGDNLSEVYKIYICKNKRRIDLTNKIAIMAYVNEYGNKKSNILALNITNASQGEIELPITNVISSENGVYACQIAIYGENNSLEQTAPFSLIVENNIFSKISNSAINSSDFHILSEAIKTTNSYGEKLKQGTENIELQYAEKLNNKMNKNDVLSMANMGQDVKEAMTGGSVAIVGVDAVLNENIKPETIEPNSTTFYENGFNILKYEIDKTNINKNISNSDGSAYSATGFSSTDFIRVKPNTQYIGFIKDKYSNLTKIYDRLCFYDSQRKFISTLDGSNRSNNIKFTTPSNCYFIRFSQYKNSGIDFRSMYLGENDTDILFIGGYYKLKKEPKINIREESYNRFNKDKIVENYRCSATVDFGLYHEDSELLNKTDGYWVSDYIEVWEDENIHIGYFLNKFNYFDSSQKYLSFYDEEKRLMHKQGISEVIKIPRGVKYIRVYHNQNKDIVMITSDLPEKYIPYAENIYVGQDIVAKKNESSEWCNKMIATYGDSITAIGNGTDVYDYKNNVFVEKAKKESWQEYVVKSLMFKKHIGRGVGGQTFKWNTETWYANSDGSYADRSPNPQPEDTTVHKGSFCSWDRIKTMLNPNLDIIFIMGGTNDFAQNTPIGDTEFKAENKSDIDWQADNTYREFEGDFNINTFKGGIASTIMKVQAYCPNSVIVLGTQLSGAGNEKNKNMTKQVKNTLNLTPYDYTKALKEVAEEFSIPYIDVFATTGINQFNRKTYIDDQYHPYNSKGKKALARAVIGGLKNILPNIL